MKLNNLVLARLRSLGAVVLCFTVLGCSTTGGVGSRKADSQGMYRVRSGDTLSLIARDNGVSYVDIMNWNNLTDPNRIDVGWRLRVRPSAVQKPSVGAVPSVGGRTQVVVAPPRDPEIVVTPVVVNPVSWLWPSSGPVLQWFDGSVSKGLVLGGVRGSPVLSASAGEVIYAGNSLRGFGNMVVIRHNDTWSSVYANNEALMVRQGERVVAGEQIATMGSSDASRVQLYFEVRLNAKPFDPVKVLPARGK